MSSPGAVPASSSPAPAAMASTSASPRESILAFAQAALAARSQEVRFLNRSTARRRAFLLDRGRPSAERSVTRLSTSDLRSPLASRKLVSILAALAPDQYEDVQLLIERAYALYRQEYERAWRSLALAQPDAGSASASQPKDQTSEQDRLMIQAFLVSVLDWEPLEHLGPDLLLDEDEDEEMRELDAAYESQHRSIIEQLSSAGGEAGSSAAPPSQDTSLPNDAGSSSSRSEAVRLLHKRSLAFQQQLDLAFAGVESQQEKELVENFNAIVYISDQPFVLTLDASQSLRFQTKYLHILAKRCIFLLESALRLRLMVHYSRLPKLDSASDNPRVCADMSFFKMIEATGPSDTSGSLDWLSGAIEERTRPFAFEKRRSSRKRSASGDAGNAKAYDLGVLQFNALLRKQLKAPGATIPAMMELMVEEGSGSLSRLRSPYSSSRRTAARRLERAAPVEAAANANFWQVARQAFPNLAADQAAAGPIDARQIFQRRPREAFSLRQFLLSFIPNSVQTALYNGIVPAPIRILISYPEARQLLPRLLMHTGWLLFKIFIFVTVLTARLGVPIPAGHPQDRPGQAGARGAASARDGRGQQGQGNAQAAGQGFSINTETLAKLATFAGWLNLIDNALATLGCPPLSVYWQLYGICLGVLLFVVWDMERWLNRRLERIRREERRNNRANNADGRAPPPPARHAAGMGRQAPRLAGAAPAPEGQPGAETPDENGTGINPDALPAPPAYPPPVYAPRRITVFARQRRDPNQQLGIVVAASLGPAPLLTYLLERLAYIGLDREDAELGLIPRSRVPTGAIIDDSTGLIRTIYRASTGSYSTRAAQRLQAPPRQLALLYQDIESEHPTAIHRSGRMPLALIGRAMSARGRTGWEIVQSLAFEVMMRIVMAFALMLISVIPECEILRRRAIDRRTEIWRNARRREIERRAKVAEHRAELARWAETALRAELEKEKEQDAAGPTPSSDAAPSPHGQGGGEVSSSLRRRAPVTGPANELNSSDDTA
ncbi:hypothetical protein OC844_000332 [Tilletia horrida]|nr:hypothetical protein OC844_000332 [Tilletia horrida]